MTPAWLLHADTQWYVVNKPTHTSTHGAWEGDLALLEWMELHKGEKLFVCSRLDKGTSGVLVFARTKEASAEAQRIHEEGRALKRYVFASSAPARAGTWSETTPIDGKPACTEFRFLSQTSQTSQSGQPGSVTFYEAVIARGRTHQIRIHASRSGVALLGDIDYGGAPFARLMLHCAKVEWPGDNSWNAPLPPSFEAMQAGAGLAQATLEAARDRRLSWPASVASAYRVLHRGEAELPSVRGEVAVDLYGAFLCVWWYGDPLTQSSAAFASRERALSGLCSAWGARGAIVRELNRNAHKRGLVGGVFSIGETPPAEYLVEEHGLRFVVSLTERQHLGLFLDQRDNRRRLMQDAARARVANLFSYSCSFSVHAAAAECEVVFSVDAAESALALGKRNFEENNLAATRRGKFIAEDVRAFLSRQARKVERDGDAARFDLIVCDPPTFSSTRELGVFHVADAWEELARGCEKVLKPGGTAYFSTNHRGAERDAYQASLARLFPEVTRFSAPMDFPEFDAHDTHVKLFRCRKAARA